MIGIIFLKIPIVFSLFCFPQTDFEPYSYPPLEFETSKEVQVVTSFAEMGIKDDLLRGIYQYGFEKPSAIQQRAVVPILQGRDVIAQAQSGTGKTSMIGLTVCQIVDTSSRECVLLNLFSLFSFPFCTSSASSIFLSQSTRTDKSLLYN